jgi:formamidopyrimidine-DNA glycosylase
MPELPEVEHARSALERRAVGRRIEAVVGGDDTRVVAEGLATERLLGRSVRASRRHGKWGFLELEGGLALLYHLGMTGAWRYPDDEPLALASARRDPDRSWPPRFTKLLIELSGGTRLAYTSARRLGRILVRTDPERQPPIAELGFDAYRELPSLPAFRRALEGRRGKLKGLLLDQRFAAGTGNWIADEVLYQAGLDPRRTVNSLGPAEQKQLHGALGEVVRIAVAADARKEALPQSWLFHHRWSKGFDARTAAGERVEYLSIAGRTTAWVPSRQR